MRFVVRPATRAHPVRRIFEPVPAPHGRSGRTETGHDEGMDFSGDGPWELPLTGFRVEHVTFAMSLSVGLQGDDARAVISLPGSFDIEEPGSGSRHLDPETQSWDELAVVLALRDDRVSRAVAGSDSALRVEFSTGRVLRASSQGEFENWEVAGPDFTIVGTPGAITIWDEDIRALASSLDAFELGDLLERLKAERPGS